MKIITAEQTRQLDAYTIKHEPIPSIDLMERAASTFAKWFIEKYQEAVIPVVIFCGPGNNGGDGLAIARMLHHKGYEVKVVLCQISKNTSEDYNINLERLPKKDTILVELLEKGDDLPSLPGSAIIIDALFGSGLNRPVEGYWGKLLQHLNEAEGCTRISVDIPSGMFADQPTEGISFEAHLTFSFELPKLGFFFPENFHRVGQWEARSIGLDQGFIGELTTEQYYLDEAMAKKIWRPRNKFDHKGHFGHALLICGSYGKMGAAVLAARACLRSGAGLLTVHIPQCGYTTMQSSLPEAMASVDLGTHYFSSVPDLSPYKAIGIGSGLDKQSESRTALRQVLEKTEIPLVLDADALNIIAEENWQTLIPGHSILTPHPKEFERLFGPSAHSFERLELAKQKAKQLQLYIILKGAHSLIVCPDGRVYFNSTGNPGMATAGSGDVLTGMVTSFMAQGYSPQDAALFGVYLHGLAGDLAAKEIGLEAMIAGDLVAHIGEGYKRLG
jgi:hydroxyethylthiazole kinase-like uncharacterized protein yjeF